MPSSNVCYFFSFPKDSSQVEHHIRLFQISLLFNLCNVIRIVSKYILLHNIEAASCTGTNKIEKMLIPRKLNNSNRVFSLILIPMNTTELQYLKFTNLKLISPYFSEIILLIFVCFDL